MPHFSQNKARVGNERDADGRGDELVVLLLDGAGDPDGQHLVAEVATRLQVDGFVLPRFGEQTLQVRRSWFSPLEGLCCLTFLSSVSVEKRPDRERRR